MKNHTQIPLQGSVPSGETVDATLCGTTGLSEGDDPGGNETLRPNRSVDDGHAGSTPASALNISDMLYEECRDLGVFHD